jgi:tetratricopeptide (TPR) repeat protein
MQLALAQTDSKTSAPPTNRPIQDKWALIVGIGKFQNKSIPSLKYATKDARDFRDYLVNEAHFAPDHVRVLLDDMATERNIRSEMGTKFLPRVVRPDDLVVLFFSTHGSSGFLDQKGWNYLLSYDSEPDDLYSTAIPMDEVVQDITRRLSADRSVLVLDACHSGAADKELIASEGNAKDLKRISGVDVSTLAIGTGQMAICSSSPSQLSWESKRYANGVFTRKLIEGLRNKQNAAAVVDTFDQVKRAVHDEVIEDYGQSQTPVLLDKWKGSELVLSVVPAQPRFLPPGLWQSLGPDSLNARSAKPVGSAITSPARPNSPAQQRPDSDWRRAVAMFKRGDYASAADILADATKHGAEKEFDAHYYLAHAYTRLSKSDQALREYRLAFALKPTGKDGDYCLQMINYFGSTAKGRTLSSSGQTAVLTVPQTFPNSSSATANVSAGASSFSTDTEPDPKMVAAVRSKLRPVKPAKLEVAPISEVLAWTLEQRSDYVPQARANVESARQIFEDGQQLYTDAMNSAKSLLPQVRQFGETEPHFKQRHAAAIESQSRLVAPYAAEVKARQDQLLAQQEILEKCELAQESIYKGRPK